MNLNSLNDDQKYNKKKRIIKKLINIIIIVLEYKKCD